MAVNRRWTNIFLIQTYGLLPSRQWSLGNCCLSKITAPEDGWKVTLEMKYQCFHPGSYQVSLNSIQLYLHNPDKHPINQPTNQLCVWEFEKVRSKAAFKTKEIWYVKYLTKTMHTRCRRTLVYTHLWCNLKTLDTNFPIQIQGLSKSTFAATAGISCSVLVPVLIVHSEIHLSCAHLINTWVCIWLNMQQPIRNSALLVFKNRYSQGKF